MDRWGEAAGDGARGAGGCTHRPVDLAALRAWAWDRGRTDVVLHLDVHAAAWSAHLDPSWAKVARLVAVLPKGMAEPGFGARLHDLALSGVRGPGWDGVRPALGQWCEARCAVLSADLAEMAADQSGEERRTWSAGSVTPHPVDGGH